MKHLFKSFLTLLSVALFTAASAQTTGAYIKYDLNGKPTTIKSADIGNYNKYEPASEDTKSHNKHVLYVSYSYKGAYKIDISIHTPPHAAPSVGKLSYVPIYCDPDAQCYGAYVSMTKNVGDDFEFYASLEDNGGTFEITKVENGWVEGIFSVDLPRQYSLDDLEPLHITNGSFRFKIYKEMKD